MSLRTVALGLLGLALAAALGLAGYVVARDTFALPATSLPAGGDLAPTATARAAAQPRVPPTTTGRAAATTREDDDRDGDDDDRSGRGRGGNSGPGGGDSSGSGGNSGPGGGDDD